MTDQLQNTFLLSHFRVSSVFRTSLLPFQHCWTKCYCDQIQVKRCTAAQQFSMTVCGSTYILVYYAMMRYDELKRNLILILFFLSLSSILFPHERIALFMSECLCSNGCATHHHFHTAHSGLIFFLLLVYSAIIFVF